MIHYSDVTYVLKRRHLHLFRRTFPCYLLLAQHSWYYARVHRPAGILFRIFRARTASFECPSTSYLAQLQLKGSIWEKNEKVKVSQHISSQPLRCVGVLQNRCKIVTDSPHCHLQKIAKLFKIEKSAAGENPKSWHYTKLSSCESTSVDGKKTLFLFS